MLSSAKYSSYRNETPNSYSVRFTVSLFLLDNASLISR